MTTAVESQKKGLQWRRLDDRLVSLCLGVAENIELSQSRIVEEMNKFDMTRNEEAFAAFVSWKIHLLD
jgi:hypothetical protein